jgi:two-component system, NarL family, response regulator LiaR
MSETHPIRVLIVDDHALVRSGLKNFLYAYDWIEPVGEAANGVEAISFCTAHEVDVVLMDVVMPEMDGVEAAQRIVSLGKPIKIIILTSFHEQDRIQRALKAGATSYLLKNVTAEDLAQSIQAAYSGRSTLAPEATTALINAARNKPDLGSDLTDREHQVLNLLVKGLANSEIAANLHISTATAKYHLNNIYSKLGAKGRVEAVTIAMDHKLVSSD